MEIRKKIFFGNALHICVKEKKSFTKNPDAKRLIS